MGTKRIIDCLLNRGRSLEKETLFFKSRKHEALINDLANYLDSHRNYFGICHIEQAHALNERGVDLLLTSEEKIGFQIKSEYDVSQKDFAARVKSQFTESLSFDLSHYYILVCAPMPEYKHRINHLINDINLIQRVENTIISLINLVIPFRDKPNVDRDELLMKRAITDDALHDYELGYEHLAEVMDADIEKAYAKVEELEKLGHDRFDDDECWEAWRNYMDIWQRKKREQFEANFNPSLPDEIKEKRQKLIDSIADLLQMCRECSKWNDSWEYRLAPYIENVPEEMIPYTSLPNLLLIQANLNEYYQLCAKGD